MKKTIKLVVILTILYSPGYTQIKKLYNISSIDKHTNFELGITPAKALVYRINYFGNEILSWSSLGLVVNGSLLGAAVLIDKKQERTNKESFPWPLGENDTIQNYYNEAIFSCSSKAVPFRVTVRIFNGAVAFRYELAAGGVPGQRVSAETTSFNFTSPYTVYQYNQESVFTPVNLDSLTNRCDFPATLTNNKFFVSIGEADNRDYTKAELKKGELSNSLAVAFNKDSVVRVNGPFKSPWRTVSISKSAVGLHDYSELYLKLAEPASAASLTWIKPGKLIRAQLNTQSGLDCIDFASRHNFNYIMFDAGWYGAEFRSTSDPTQVIPQIDMPKVIAYGREKSIGIILYVNYVGLKAKLDTILPLFKKWGVSGMKFGFVDGLSQSGLTWLAGAIRKVNDYRFILDIHDNYKPTGLSRTFPALLTQEGIRGDENSPDAFHTTVLPFTRFLAGPADFTFCFPNSKNSFGKNLKVSKGQQLALTVIYFSPLQSVFWYGQPNDYTNEGEIEFFKYVPTVWNRSIYLAGDIGKNISVARRSGDTWFVGNAAGMEDWNGNISLGFLNQGTRYMATSYEDDGSGGIVKKEYAVQKDDRFKIQIKAKEGQALIINLIK